MRPKTASVLFWSILIIVFLALAGSVSLVAAGYQFDWQEKRLTRTGLIFLQGSPRQVTVTINGQVVAERLPVRLPTVFPDDYEVTIAKEGYTTWRKVFTIEPGEGRAETDILLFFSAPEVSQVTDPDLIRDVKENTAASPLIDGREIRFNNRLVTRVSGDLLSAALSPQRSHIFFQIGKEIRVIEIDGTNEVLLFTLDSDKPSQLLVLDDAKEIALLDGSVVKRLRIR